MLNRGPIHGDTPLDRLLIAVSVVAFFVIVIFGADWLGAWL